jgi:hypothetical protein
MAVLFLGGNLEVTRQGREPLRTCMGPLRQIWMYMHINYSLRTYFWNLLKEHQTQNQKYFYRVLTLSRALLIVCLWVWRSSIIWLPICSVTRKQTFGNPNQQNNITVDLYSCILFTCNILHLTPKNIYLTYLQHGIYADRQNCQNIRKLIKTISMDSTFTCFYCYSVALIQLSWRPF